MGEKIHTRILSTQTTKHPLLYEMSNFSFNFFLCKITMCNIVQKILKREFYQLVFFMKFKISASIQKWGKFQF